MPDEAYSVKVGEGKAMTDKDATSLYITVTQEDKGIYNKVAALYSENEKLKGEKSQAYQDMNDVVKLTPGQRGNLINAANDLEKASGEFARNKTPANYQKVKDAEASIKSQADIITNYSDRSGELVDAAKRYAHAIDEIKGKEQQMTDVAMQTKRRPEEVKGSQAVIVIVKKQEPVQLEKRGSTLAKQTQ